MPEKSKNLRVLHVSTWGIPCGIATYCGNLVKSLDGLGVESGVHPLVPHFWASALPQDVRSLEGELERTSQEYDLVHIQHEHGLFGAALGNRIATRNFGRVLRRLLAAKKPVITTFHTAPLAQRKHRHVPSLFPAIKNWNRRRQWRKSVVNNFAAGPRGARAIVHAAPTRYAFAKLGIPADSIHVVAHGCLPQKTHAMDARTAKERLGLPAHATLLTIFGFVGHYKGQDLAVRALQELPSHYRLAICGGAHPDARDGYLAGLVQLIKELGLEERVVVTGWLPEEKADLYYSATDICLAPYRESANLSASGAITWALSSGRPTIASKIDAFQSIQRESPCMLMTAAGRTAELVWAVRKLADDPELAARLVGAAGLYVQAHSWERAGKETLRIYEDVLAARVKKSSRYGALSLWGRGGERRRLKKQIAASQSLQGWCTLEKAEYLADLVLTQAPKCVVEIGVFGGRSIIPMALAAKAHGGAVYGVDPWATPACLEGDVGKSNETWWGNLDIEGIHAGFMAAIDAFAVRDTLRVLRMTDREALPHFQDGQIGVLHVDGNHSAEVSRRYIEQWGPKVAAGGYLVMDDIDWSTQAETVRLIEQSWETVQKWPTWAVYRKGRAAQVFHAVQSDAPATPKSNRAAA